MHSQSDRDPCPGCGFQLRPGPGLDSFGNSSSNSIR